MAGLAEGFGICPAVVPVLVGPLQVLLTILPGLLLALAGGVLALFKPSGIKNAIVLLWRQKIAVGVVAAISVGVYLGAKQTWPRGAAAGVTTAQQGDDWPTARGDLTRCAAVLDKGSPTRDQLIWTYRPGEEGFLASPAVVGNRVYISSAQLGISKSGAIHCVDADSGAVVWTSAPPDYRPTFSSPVISGDFLVCGEGLHDTRDARVICLDRHDGKVLWTFRTKNHVECTPVVANGRVYVGAGDDGVYCLDLKPGPDAQAKVNWHKPAEQFPDAETSLAVHDGKVYVGLGNAGAALVMLDAITGDELHRLKMPYPVFSPPAIAGGKLYIGMGNGDYVKAGEGGAVVCLDLKTLKIEWTHDLPQTVLGAVAVKDDKLYFGCGDGKLYCLNRSGKLIAEFPVYAPIKTSPAVTEAHVFVVSDAGLLFALDRHTLEPIWQFRLGTDGWFYSSPVVARSHVYVGTQTEGLLCVGKPASSKRTPLWAAPLGGPGVAGNSDSSPIPEAGEAHWTYPLSDGERIIADRPVASVAVWNELLYVAHSGVRTRGVECLELDKERRRPPRSLWTFETDDEVRQSPVILGEAVAFVSGAEKSQRRILHFVDRLSGELLAMRALTGAASGFLTATKHQFLVDDGMNLVSFDARGERQWTAGGAGGLACPPVANDAMILAITQNSWAIALDQATGAKLWHVALPHPAIGTPLLEKSKFLLPTRDGLAAFSMKDGLALTSWKAELGVPSGELALAGPSIVFVNQRGEVVAFDRTSHTLTARVSGALPGQTPVVSRGKVLYAARGRLMTFALGTENPAPELWLDLSALAPKEGLPTGPLVLKDSRIFTFLPGRALACLGGAK